MDIDILLQQYFKMSNDICCIITIRRRDYDLITSRLASFEVQFAEMKQIQLSLMVGVTENSKKIVENNKKLSQKCQNTIVRFTDRNFSNYLIGPANSSGYDDKFIYDASYIRVDNNFKNMMKGWSLFSDMKELFCKKIEIQTYTWKKAFIFQFIHGEADQVLMIIRDSSSSNYIQKNVNVDRDFWKTKVFLHFRDLYGMMCTNFGEHISNDGHQAMQNNPNRSKIADFEERCRVFIEKLEKFSQKSQKSLQFWLIRTAFITQFVLKHRILQINKR